MKIYTKTGDGGQSYLYNGNRLPKSSEYFMALGDLDELNAHLAMTRALWRDEVGDKLYSAPGAGAMFYRDKPSVTPPEYDGPPLYYEWYSLGIMLQEIQQNLMDISSTIATPGCGDKFFNPAWIDKIEKQIDRFAILLPPLTKFVIPSGNKLNASIHIARAVCRRAERMMITVVEPGCPSHLYLNRLSDYLFMASRFVCMSLGINEDLKK